MGGMNKASVHHITKTLTPEAIMERLGVSFHMIRHARTTGAFPASWYRQMKDMCDEVGIPCPLTAFNWRPSANQVGSAPTAVQGAGAENANGAA